MGPGEGLYEPVGMAADVPLDSSPPSMDNEEDMEAAISAPLGGQHAKGDLLVPDDEASARPALSTAAAKVGASMEAAASGHLDKDELARMSTAKFREVRASAKAELAPDRVQAKDGGDNLPAEEMSPEGMGTAIATPRPIRFRIKVDKGEGEKKLGLDTVALLTARDGVLQREKGALKVQLVKPDGLVSAWNAAHKRRQVREGDFIVEVNGVRGTSQELYSAIRQGTTLDLQLLRLP